MCVIIAEFFLIVKRKNKNFLKILSIWFYLVSAFLELIKNEPFSCKYLSQREIVKIWYNISNKRNLEDQNHGINENTNCWF